MKRKDRKYHYFYKITNNINNHFYYGVHNTDDLDDGYMGSGTRLHYAYKKYGIENFTKEIIKFFDTMDEAFEYEAEMVTERLVMDPNCYNLKLGGDGFCTSGLTQVKDKDGNIFLTSVNDPRYLSGELIHINTGKCTYKNINTGEIITVLTTDPILNSNEYIPLTAGRSIYKNINTGEILVMSINDDRLKTGEYVGHTKNKITVKDKNNNYYSVDKDDPRYVSGELVFFWKDKKHTEETKLKLKLWHKLNHPQAGEKNSLFGTCWITKDQVNKKIKKDELVQYESNGWKLGKYVKHNDIDINFCKELYELHKLLGTYKKVAEKYNISESTIKRRVRYYKNNI